MSVNDILSHHRLLIFLLVFNGASLLLPASDVSSLASHRKTNTIDPKYLTPVERELLRRSKAAEIKSWLDTSVEPCNDFYDFVCGNWHRINGGGGGGGGDGKDANSNGPLRGMTKRVWDFLNTPKLRVLDSPENKILTFYESCRKMAKDTCLYEASLRKMTDEIGEFSFLKKKGAGKRQLLSFQWWLAVAKVFSYYGKSLMISVQVDYDLKDRTKAAIYLSEPPQLLKNSRKYNMLRSHYSATPEQAQRVADNVEQFEEALGKAGFDVSSSGHTPAEEYTLYNRTDVQELFKDLFNMDTYLMISFNTTSLPKQLYVQNNKYFENLAVLLKDINMDIVEDYILLGVLEKFPVIQANVTTLDDWCSLNTRKYFMKFMEHAVYQQYRSADFEKDLYELWYEIKAVFLSELQSERYHWMSRETREQAIRKLKYLTFHINSYDDMNFEEYFKDLHIDPLNYVINTQNIHRHMLWQMGTRLHLKSIESFSDKNLYSPMYYSRLNQFKVPVACLQPFETWHAAYPHAIKYAHLGYLLAREMLRAFDDYHRHFDAEGQVSDWWDATATNEYEARRRCFQAQYHNVTMDNAPSQGVNIADYGAVKIAYSAYLRWVEWATGWGADMNIHETFTNLPYNHNELFFISFGQQWCPDGTNKNGDAGDVPRKYRANGPLSNFPMFSQVFKCLAKSPMNPTKKCEIF